MIRKLVDSAPRMTRQHIADPHAGVSHQQRLKRVEAIDLRNNKIVEDHGDGYATVRPIDAGKRFKNNG